MKLYFIRHGMTVGNSLSRYIGSTDEPLSPEGIALAKSIRYDIECDRVFVTPLLRTQQTAEILFPGVEQSVVRDLREMDFGVFEDRSAADMEKDPKYRQWVEGMCKGPCPGGEDMLGFSGRVCAAFEELVNMLREGKAEKAVFVLHGGTIMAIMERFASPKKSYYEYMLKNCACISCSLNEENSPVLSGLEYFNM